MSSNGVGHGAPGADHRLSHSLHLLSRGRWWILGITLAALAAAAIGTRLQRPQYTSATVIRIDEEESALSLLGGGERALRGGGSRIDTEVDVLRSRRIVEAAASSLGLHVELLEPRAPRGQVLQALEASRAAAPGSYVVEPDASGGYTLRMEGSGTEVRGRAGEPLRLGGVTVVVNPGFARRRSNTTIRLRVTEFQRAVADAQEDLAVLRPNPRSQLVRIQYRSTDRLLAAEFPNALAESFIAYKRGSSKTESGSTVDFLREQVDAYATQLRESEQRLREFREEANVVNLEEEGTEQVRRLANLQVQREEVAQERDGLQRILSSVSQPSEAGGSRYRQLAAFPSFLSNRAIQDLLQSLTALETRRSDLRLMRTAESDEVQLVNRRITEIEEQLHETAVSYLQNLNIRLQSLDAELGRFTAASRQMPGREIEFLRRMRQQRLLEELSTLLETRLKEAEIQNAITPGDVQVIDEALVPTQPVSPRPMLNLALAAVLGLALGVGTVLLREQMDTRVRTRDDVLVATGGFPVLGTVPSFGPAPVNGRAAASGKRRGAAPAAHRVVVLEEPQSPATEAYRAIRTSVSFVDPESAPRVLVVTSALPGDGKTTSSSNLAAAFAQQEMRVLLVDADLRRGVLHNVFQIPQAPGLTHVLTGNGTLESAVKEVTPAGTPGSLHVLPGGVPPPNPAELLGSRRMREFVATVRERYDVVIFDAPPLNLVTDAALLGQMADTTLVVARVGNTQKPALVHAAGQLRQLHAKVGGVILNGVSATDGAYGYGYGGANGHG